MVGEWRVVARGEKTRRSDDRAELSSETHEDFQNGCSYRSSSANISLSTTRMGVPGTVSSPARSSSSEEPV